MEWLSRILKIDFPYFFRGSFWLSLGQASSIAFSFLLALIFARNLDPQTYGQYRYLMSITSVLAAFSLTGMGTALSQAVAQGKVRTLLVLFHKQLIWSLPAALIGGILASITLMRGNFSYSWVFLIFSISFPISNAASLFNHYLNGQRNFSLATKYYLVSSFLTNGFLIVSALFFPTYFLFLFPLIFALEMIFNVIVYRRIATGIKTGKEIDEHTLSFGKHLSAANVLTTVADQVDSTFLFLLAGPQNLAVYSFAIAGPEILKNFFKSSTVLSLPKLSVMNEVEIKATLPHHAIKLFSITLAAVFLYILAAPTLFSVLFPKYLAAVPLSQIFVVSLLASPSYLFLSAFQAKKAVRKIYFVNVVNSVATIAITVLFIYLWGLYGLIIARVLARFFVLLSFVFTFYFV